MFALDDMSSAISTLQGSGVTFEDYDLPDLKTVDHVCEFGDERAVWFKDPDGNVLCLHQTVS